MIDATRLKNYPVSMQSGITFQISAMILLLLLSGCRPAPTEDLVRNLILKDFESRHFKVIKLQISDIKPSSGEKRYMTSDTYIADIPLITLRATQDIGNLKMGEQLSFRDARVGLREDIYQEEKWIITDIRGISVP